MSRKHPSRNALKAYDNAMTDDLDEVSGPLGYLEELEERHTEQDPDDDDDSAFESWIDDLEDRYEDIARLQGLASDEDFLNATADFGMAEYVQSRLLKAEDLRDISEGDDSPSLEEYLEERQKRYDHSAGQKEGPRYIHDVDENREDLQKAEGNDNLKRAYARVGIEFPVSALSIEEQMERANKIDQVDPAVAKLITRSGKDDGDATDDILKVKKSTWPASKLKPSQTTMQLPKAIGMALFMLKSGKIGGNLGAIVSKDNHILDGHHRWAATILATGKKGKVGGWAAASPGQKLLAVLNVISKGMFGVRNGNPGSGRIADFAPREVRALLTDYVENGIPGKFPWSAEDVREVLEDNFGSVEEGIDAMAANVRLISKDVPKWAPDRKQMPVIDPEQVPDAAEALNEGIVDWNKPHVSSSLDKRLAELDRLMSSSGRRGAEVDADAASAINRMLGGLTKQVEKALSKAGVNTSDVEEELSDVQTALKALEERMQSRYLGASVKAARAASVDYPRALLVAREIEGELSRLADGRVRDKTRYISLKRIRLKARKLKAMLD